MVDEKVDDDLEDEEDDEEEDDEEEEEEAPPPPKKSSQADRGRKAAAPARAATAPANVAMPRVALFVALALAAGGAAGWFGHEAQAKAKVKAESAAAPAGSGAPSGPCGAWQGKICSSAGERSAACSQAKGAVELLTPASCETAMSMLPATLTKLKAARASCDSLVSKLCKDLPPGSQACDMVKERTPSFPSSRCDEMLKKYDDVLKSLQQMDQHMGPGMGAPKLGGPGMGRPAMSLPHPAAPGGAPAPAPAAPH
jgi:hypothetical protein